MGDVRHILIVEDDAAFAEFLRIAIESLGHRTTIVGSGGTALEAYRAARPDLVFLDLLLPQRDGFKICEDIRAEPEGARLPIVMMTGIYKKPSYEKNALERLKVAEYLIKPFGVREVWAAIERHLGQSMLKGANRVGDATQAGWSLTESPLACQLSEHLRLRSDGVMFIRGPEATFVLYLRDGAPVFIRSSDQSDRLDRVVARTTRIPEPAIADCLREASDSRGRKRLGDVLVERRLISRDELEIALQLQLRLILNRAFGLEKGCCLFVPGEHPTEEDVILQGSPRSLLVRGARATAPALVATHLPSDGSVLVRTDGWEALIPDLGLKEDEIRLLQLCDGATTVERFLATSAACGYDGPRILLALLCSGLVTDVPFDRGSARRATLPEAASLDVAGWSTRPIGALVSELYRLAASGRLEIVVEEGQDPKVLHFRDGEIVSVSSGADADRLAAMLLQMQVVEPAALDSVVEALGRGASDTIFLRTLIDRQLLSPVEGYWASVYRAHGAVHDVLPVLPASLAWTACALDPGITPIPDVPTIELALNGVRCLDAATVRAMLPPGDRRVTARKDVDPRGTPLAGGELALLNRLAASQNLHAFCASADDPAGRSRAVLALMQLGLVETQAPAAPPATSTIGHVALPLADHATPAGPSADPVEAVATVGFAADLAREPPAAAPAEPEPSVRAASRGPRALDRVLDLFDGVAADDDDEHWVALATARPAMAPRPIESRPRFDETVPTTAAAAALDETEEPASECATVENVIERLLALRPTLQALRAGFAGDDRRVTVDRARMAELLDELLATVALAREIPSPEAPPAQREAVGAR